MANPSIRLPSFNSSEFTRHASEKQLNTSNYNWGDKKLLQYFERQSAAIGKLTERVKRQEEKERLNTDRELNSFRNRNESSKKSNLSPKSKFENTKIRTNEEICSDSESESGEISSKVREEVIQKIPKAKFNPLEALVRSNLVAKSSNRSNNKKEITPRSDILTIRQSELTEREHFKIKREQDLDKELEEIHIKKISNIRTDSVDNSKLEPGRMERPNDLAYLRQRKYLKERRSRIGSTLVDSSNKSNNDSSPAVLSKKGNFVPLNCCT